jgi:DNA-binding XRE family transcriptional regulator
MSGEANRERNEELEKELEKYKEALKLAGKMAAIVQSMDKVPVMRAGDLLCKLSDAFCEYNNFLIDWAIDSNKFKG